jgi:hypothetical protein
MVGGGGADLRPFYRWARRAPERFGKAQGAALLQLLTWMNTGSPRSSRTPPIRKGILRGSSSAIAGGEVVGTGPNVPGATPADRGPKSGPLFGYLVYNVPYAARMHEHEGQWGEKTLQAGDAGRKWMEEHLRADRDAFLEVLAAEFKRRAGT